MNGRSALMVRHTGERLFSRHRVFRGRRAAWPGLSRWRSPFYPSS